MPEYRVVDAFTNQPLSGNPAAVLVVDEPYDDAWAQGIAAEFNLSETAFARRIESAEAEFELRWFTPEVEVDLCGHATLATAHALTEQGVEGPIRFSTRSGVLTVERRDGRLWMDFPARPAVREEVPAGLADALGAEPLWVGRGGTNDLLVEVADEATVRSLSPDQRALTAIPARGVIVTARGADTATGSGGDRAYDIVSRFFAPSVGVPEDPVTGSAHTVLAPFWAERLGRTELTAHQASARGGDLDVRLVGDRVMLGGDAVTFATGHLNPSTGPRGPAGERWATKEEIHAARERLEAGHADWVRPAAYGVGVHRDGETAFGLTNVGTSPLPAIVLAIECGHTSGTATYELTPGRLATAMAALAPAEACTELQHPNLVEWKRLAAEIEEKGGRAVAVFVGDLEDDPVDDHDRAFRAAIA
ncbi:hypothetical protein GCM10027590_68060 [Nocardiopsis nanhaiensis]